MLLQESLTLVTLIVTIYCLLAARLIKDEMQQNQATPYFISFYLGALLVFILIRQQLAADYWFELIYLDFAGVLFASSFPLGLCKRHQHSRLFNILLIAIGIYLVVVLLTNIKVHSVYLLVIFSNTIACISIIRRKPAANFADIGIVITLATIGILLLYELARIPIKIDIKQYLALYFDNVLIFFPAYISGLTILLIASHMQDANNTLAQLASHDPLTGLLNRRSLFQFTQAHLSRLKRNNGKSSIIITDLDRFKSVNDNYGHNTGDRVIKSFADTIKDSLRDYDIAARYGGEEFLIFLPDTGLDQALVVAERIRSKQESTSIQTDKETIYVTASFGVAEVSANWVLDRNIEVADKQLYAAKNAGRNRVCSLKGGQSSIIKA